MKAFNVGLYFLILLIESSTKEIGESSPVSILQDSSLMVAKFSLISIIVSVYL
jgi:hypothetical protein